MKKWIIGTFLLLVAIAVSIFLFIGNAQEKYSEIKFDLQHENKRIDTEEQIREILDSFPTIKIEDTDKSYLDWTKPVGARFYLVPNILLPLAAIKTKTRQRR